MGWGGRLLIGFVLILAGAAAATWGLARSDTAARVLGVSRSAPLGQPQRQEAQVPQQASAQGEDATTLNPVIAEQIRQLQSRVQRVENENEQVQGSAGRADALLIAFSARRAVERGVALGYLEPLLVNRFGTRHPQAVATIVTESRSPVRLSELISTFRDLEPQLVGPPPNEGLWTGIKRGLGSLISVHHSDRPSNRPQARFDRALAHLMAGEVDSALAEAMRLPGASRAGDWIRNARRYIAVHRALDQIESAALVGDGTAPEPAPAVPPAH